MPSASGSFPRLAAACRLLALLLAASPAAALTAEEHLTSQIDWILSKGGYYSSKIEYRNLVPGDASSPLGMFLTEPADRDEVLMVIPHACLFTTGDDGSTDTCDTVRRLARELERGEGGDHWPYVRYCFDPRHDGDLPATWSDPGRDLIQSIGGEELFPDRGFDVLGMTYENACGEGGTELERQAYHHVLRRSWDDVMVPVFDMVNHRNGPYRNVDSNSAHLPGRDVRVVALRDIDAGEQLFLSYNECTDCGKCSLVQGIR